jgi:hypothetical protein
MMRTNMVRPVDPRYTWIAAFDVYTRRVLSPSIIYLSVIQKIFGYSRSVAAVMAKLVWLLH